MIRNTRARFGLLSFVAFSTLAGTPAALGQNMALRGTIRDFRSTHVDFAPGLTSGHFAGNVGLTLGSDEKPAYTASGYEVVSEWRDNAGRPIAPNMFFLGTVPVQVVTVGETLAKSYIDSFDYSTGPYDPASAGGAAFMGGATMPAVSVPLLLAAPVNKYVLDANKGVTTLSTDLRCNDFTIRNHHTLMIDGDVTIVVEDTFLLEDYAAIDLASGASLKLYIKHRARIRDWGSINASGKQPGDVEIYYLGTEDFVIQNQCTIYANFTSPDGDLDLYDDTHLYGAVTAQQIDLNNQSGLHADGVPNLCSMAINDTRGTAGGPGGGIDSAYTFGQWFNDVMGVNAGRPHTVLMANDGSGVYTYSDNSFFPIDDKLYGNEGADHNYRFTYEVRASFTYNACSGQSLWFEGSDDCWIYIDDQLVIDLGGVAPGAGQFINIDRLDLVDGETYSFRLFYAHRTASTPRFNMRTNIELIPEPVTMGVASFPRHD